MFIEFNVLKEGDEVLNVTQSFIAVKHKDKTVELFPLKSDEGHIRIDKANIVKIGFGTNSVTYEEDGFEVTNF